MKSKTMAVMAFGALTFALSAGVKPRIILDSERLEYVSFAQPKAGNLNSGWRMDGAAFVRPFNRQTAGLVRYAATFLLPADVAAELRFEDAKCCVLKSEKIVGGKPCPVRGTFAQDGSLARVRLAPSKAIAPKGVFAKPFRVTVDWATDEDFTYAGARSGADGVRALPDGWRGEKAQVVDLPCSYCAWKDGKPGHDRAASDAVLEIAPVGWVDPCADPKLLTESYVFEFDALIEKDTKLAFGDIDLNALYRYTPNVWYHFRFEVENGRAKVRLNGRVITERKVGRESRSTADGSSSFANCTIENLSKSVRLLVDDVKAFALVTPADYPPAPVRVKGEEKWDVIMNICSLWYNGYHAGWNCVEKGGGPRLVLGYYDEGLPETADWEIKYMVDHGVDVQAFCWYPETHDGPIRHPRNEFHLRDGYKNARYSDRMKYCLIWEIQNAGRPHSLEAWKRNYVPYLIEHHFKDPRYYAPDGKPMLVVFGGWNFSNKTSFGSTAETKAAFDYLEQELKKLGFKGLVAVSSNWHSGRDDLAACGFTARCAYNYGTEGWKVETQKTRNVARAAIPGAFAIPTVSVGFDSEPWHGKKFPMMSPADLRTSLAWVRDEFIPSQKHAEPWQAKAVWLSTWNEYGEGTYMMPSEDERGFGYLDAVRAVFTDEPPDPKLNVKPTPVQRERICNLYPQSLTENSSRSFVLARRGATADATVVVSAKALPVERYAADELTNFVFRMTGVRLPIATDAAAMPAKAVVLGATRFTPSDALPKAEPSGDAFRLLVKDGCLFVGGRKRGVLYGVYEILERFGGCRWYASWCETIPNRSSLEVPGNLADEQKPAFLMREPFWYDVCRHRDFAARLRVNGYNHTPNDVDAKFGGDDYRFGGGLSSCHTFNTLCDPKVYFDSHPEYFSFFNGKRHGKQTQLCLTNPDVLRIVTSNVLARIRKDPGAKFYGVSQNDWYNYCECDKCKAIDDAEGSHAGTMVRFVNAVAAEVEKEFPGVLIETLAYQYTRKPPKITKLRHNVVACLCTIECDFSRPLTESKYDQNVSFLTDIVGWGAQTDRLYVWDYVTNFRRYTMPHANFDALQGNVKCFRDNGVKYLFEQGDYQGVHADFAELKAWLLAKWMWNPELPEKPLLDDFFAGYYGKGAPHVRAWFEELRAAQRKWSDDPKRPLSIYENPDYAAYSDELLERGAALLAKAADAVRGDKVRTHNVRMCAFSVDCMRLERLRQNVSYDLWLSDEPFDPSVAVRARDLARRVTATLDEVPDIRLSEGIYQKLMPANWWALATNPAPGYVVGAKSGEVGASRFEGNNPVCQKAIVLCAGTKDGKALAFFETPWDWCGRYYLGNCRLPKDAPVRIRVRAKVEKAYGKVAFRTGVRISDKQVKVDRLVRDIPVSETKPDWAWYDVGTCVPGKGEFFFVGHSAEATKAGRLADVKILVDRIEISR